MFHPYDEIPLGNRQEQAGVTLRESFYLHGIPEKAKLLGQKSINTATDWGWEEGQITRGQGSLRGDEHVLYIEQ